MTNHLKIYLQGMGLDVTSYISCEVCGGVGQDIHHINARGMGGSKKADVIENLMCCCRECHIKYGDKKQYKEFLKDIHNQNLNNGNQ
jgi:hypothetical protein